MLRLLQIDTAALESNAENGKPVTEMVLIGTLMTAEDAVKDTTTLKF